jgi:hypothetical protein
MPPPISGPLSLFNLITEHLQTTLHQPRPSPGTREAGIGQPRTCPERPGHASLRAHRALDAPERQHAPPHPSFPAPPSLHRASPRQRLQARHAQAPACALSPPPAHKVVAGPVADAAFSCTIPSCFRRASKHASLAMMPATPCRPRLALSRPRDAAPWTTRAHTRSTLVPL